MKKRVSSILLSALLLLFNTSAAFALSFSDVDNDYWAYTEIESLVKKEIMSGYEDKTFKPENPVNRADFAQMVVKALDKDEMEISISNMFSDISSDFWAYDDVLRSVELDLVVGYPDNTFKPDLNITKAEATSIAAHTIKNCDECNCGKCNCGECNCKNCSVDDGLKSCVLKQFTDKKQIPTWAKKSYKKAVKNELYVNHPIQDNLEPNRAITRAETAVLLYKLRQKAALIKDEYQGPEIKEEALRSQEVVPEKPVAQKVTIQKNVSVIEHLPVNDFSTDMNKVEIKGAVAKIFADNVIPVRFANDFNGKTASQGEVVYLVVDKNIVTEEGTLVIPEGSKILAEITDLKNGRLFHRNGKMELSIISMLTPDGNAYPLSGSVVNTDVLKRNFGACNFKRIGKSTLGFAAAGAVIGVSTGAMCDETGEGSALGSIIGAGTGLLVGLVARGCPLEVSPEEAVYIQLNEDASINLK